MNFSVFFSEEGDRDVTTRTAGRVSAAFDYSETSSTAGGYILPRSASQAEDAAELSAAEATATRAAEACLSPIMPPQPPSDENSWWGHAGSLLDDAFCLSPEPELEDDGRSALLAELTELRAENGRLRTAEKQLHLMNSALNTSYHRQKARAEEAEANLERVRDRALDIILSRTAEVDRLKKELARKKVVLRADAPEFVPAAISFREAVIARLRELSATTDSN